MTLQAIDKQEVSLCGRLVKVGGWICLPDPEALKIQNPVLAAAIPWIAESIGSGPFKLLGIEYFPTDGVPLFLLNFVNESGKEKQVTSEFFVEYEGIVPEV